MEYMKKTNRMIKGKWNIFLTGLLLFGLGSLRAQEAKTCFVAMPDTLCPLLSAVNRADCIDFLESKMKAEVTNTFGAKSEMTELTADYLRLRMTPQSTWQMKLLPVNDSTKIICTVSTVCAPACDSHVEFYTTDWRKLPASSFLPDLPVMDDFIAPASADTADVYAYSAARRQADMLLMEAELSAADATLSFTLTTTDYMDKEAAEKLKPLVRRPIVYRWNKGRFILP